MIKMTRRGYYEVVDVIKRLEKSETKRLMWAHAFAEVLKKSNPAFDREKFLRAVTEKELDK
jgi:hypothetical protein